jgi:hypothetical protein
MGKGGKEKEKEGKRKGKEKEKGTEKMGKEIPNRFCTSYRLLVILLLLMSLRVEKDVSTTSLPVLAKQLRSKALTLLPPFPPLLWPIICFATLALLPFCPWFRILSPVTCRYIGASGTSVMRSIRVPPTIGGHPNVHWHPWNPLEPSGQGYRDIFSINGNNNSLFHFNAIH